MATNMLTKVLTGAGFFRAAAVASTLLVHTVGYSLISIGLQGPELRGSVSPALATSGPGAPRSRPFPKEDDTIAPQDDVVDWSSRVQEGYFGLDLSEYGTSRALCRAVLARAPAKSDQPSAHERDALYGCDSEALLFGLEVARDVKKARHCAFVQAANDTYRGPSRPFDGRAMLMHLYANGIGVERDLDLALHMACGLDSAWGEMDARVLHLAALRDGKIEDKEFSFCDDITSGYAGGQCAAHDSRLAHQGRTERLANLSSGWDVASQRALAELRLLHDDYAAKHGWFEQDPRGTIKVELSVRASEELENQFVDTVSRLSQGKQPLYDLKGLEAADIRLNSLYRKLLEPNLLLERGMEEEDVRQTQRTWLRYRDAFVDFAQRQFPGVSRTTIAAWLTEQRSAVLAFSLHGCSVASQCPSYPRRVPRHDQVISLSLKEPQE